LTRDLLNILKLCFEKHCEVRQRGSVSLQTERSIEDILRVMNREDMRYKTCSPKFRNSTSYINFKVPATSSDAVKEQGMFPYPTTLIFPFTANPVIAGMVSMKKPACS
jgi:hypothetical protein